MPFIISLTVNEQVNLHPTTFPEGMEGSLADLVWNPSQSRKARANKLGRKETTQEPLHA